MSNQTVTTDHDARLAREAAERARQAYRQSYNAALANALEQMRAAETCAVCAGSGEVEIAALRAARAMLNGMWPRRRFLSLPINPDATDFARLRDDLEFFAREVVDPLIRAIGEEAQSNSNMPGSELRECFEDVLFGAIDGNATHVLAQCGENASRTLSPAGRAEQKADHDRKLLAETR